MTVNDMISKANVGPIDCVVEGGAGKSLLCEVAWEVCQQVGGIYTVIRSKVPSIRKLWGDNYLLLGPYDPSSSPAEFEEHEPEGYLAEVVKTLRDQGFGVHFGKWLVHGQPDVILLDPRSMWPRMGHIKFLIWEHHGIALPSNDPLVDSVVAFGYMVEHFFHTLLANKSRTLPVVGHFHEWMGASCIPELRRSQAPMSIVFTTHATLLGRYLAMNDPWFYDHVPFVNWQADAQRFNIEAQVKLERAAAHGSHVFTTLSDITAFECEHLIGRKPDLLVPNGLNIERFVAMHEFQNLHREYKERIKEFVTGHFFPSYPFDLDNTLFFFTSGRYEYSNKGYDLTIEALARLNARMRRANLPQTVVFFLVTKKPFRSINPEALQCRAQMEEIRKTCNTIKDKVGERLFMKVAMGQMPKLDDLIEDHWRLRLRQMRRSWRISRLPTIVTHDLLDDATDEVINQLRSCNLVNHPDDRVKVVYHPDFVTSSSPLFALDYDQFVRGCHLGIFPSYYEPWGYTPEECMARGIPAVTSDLSGFGTYLLKNMPDYESKGLFVVHRRLNSFHVAAEQLAEYLFDFVRLDRRGRIGLRNVVESASDDFDWHNLIRNYCEAYRLVRERTGL